MSRRFVLLASERTGSNMLVTALDSHPDMRCFGELLRRNATAAKGALRILPSIDPVFMDEAYRRSHVDDYLDAVFALAAGAERVGFKLMLQQHVRLRNALIADPAVAKVLLYRENGLAAYSSDRIARVTGQGTVGLKGTIKTARVPFKPAQFEAFQAQRAQQYAVTRKRLAASGQDWLEVEYLEIARPEGIARVVAFLGADPQAELEVRTQKRNPSDILARFTNPRKVERYLAEHGLERWAHEGEGEDEGAGEGGDETAALPVDAGGAPA